MKKLLAWVLLVAMLVGLFAGCNKTPEETTEPSIIDTADLEAALEYVVTIYRKAAEKTAKDYERVANVPINGVNYEIVWTADVGEDLVKIVKGENGMVTIDVNEAVTEDTKYVLTATVSDAYGNTFSHSWNHFIPAAAAVSDADMIAIVEDAYKLAPGESLPYEATLTGKVLAINTPYDAGYKNVTVTIAVPGIEDKPIMCYRMKGDGADIIKAGYTITVTGTIKNYNGTIEFDAGCILDSYVEGEPDAAPTDPLQIVEEAYALPTGGALGYEATLTGEIISVDTAYSDQYKNITVTIEVSGAAGKPIQCYRLAGEGADKLKETDIITVTGTLMNYNGTVQFGQGCQLISVTPGTGAVQPEDPTQVVDEAYALEAGQSLPYTATLKGTVTEINYSYKEENGNMSVTMVVSGRSSKPIYCYMMTGSASELAKVSKGCTITVRGTIKKFEDWDTGETKVEFDKPTLVSCTVPSVSAGSEVSLNDGDVIVIFNPANAVALSSKKSYEGSYYNAGVLVSGTGSNLKGFGSTEKWTVKVNTNGTYSFSNNGQNIGMDDSFTSTPQGGKHDQWELISQGGGKYLIRNTGRDAYLEWYASSGSWSGYNPKDGSQTSDPLFLQSIYIVSKSETPVEPATLADAVAEIETYKDKDLTTTTLPTTLTMKGDAQFTVTWTVTGTDQITVKDNGDGTASLVFPEEIEEDIAYQLTYVVTAADGTTETATWDLTAEKVEDIAALTVKDAIDLGQSKEHNTYTEEKYAVTGVITEVSNETYGNMKISDGTNILTIYGTYDADGTNRYDAMEVKPVAGDVVTIVGIVGQYNGTSQIKNGWITEHYVGKTVEEVIALGQTKEQNTYTEEKYAVTGEITEVYNTTYGNMKITDEAGNILTIYGTYDIDGTNRYDKMEAKPVAGDTVTIVGIVGQYNGTSQIKNGWIIANTPASGEGEGGEGGGETGGEEGGETEETVDYVTEPAVDTAYKLGLKYSDGKVYYFNGTKVNNYYGGTTTTWTDAVDVKLETTEGGYYLSFVDANGTTQYIQFVQSGTYINFEFTTEKTSVFTFDEEKDAPCSVLGEETYYLGNYGSYSSMSKLTASKLSATDYIARLYAEDANAESGEGGDSGESGGETGGEGEGGDSGETTEPIEVTIIEANAIGAAQEHNTYTTEEYKVSGTITSIVNTQYGNLYIADAEGNELYIYGLYDEGGNRYDAMTTQPAVGDEITVVSALGQYYDTPQMKNATMVAHTPGSGDSGESGGETGGEGEGGDSGETDADGTILTIPEANTMGAGTGEGVYTTVKYKVTGKILAIDNTTYGNMTLVDDDGATLYVYGTYSADGSTQYGAMDTKPVVGDTVTVYGVVGNHYGSPQMKNAWIVEHTPGAGTDTDTGSTSGTFTQVTDIADITDGGEFVIAVKNGDTYEFLNNVISGKIKATLEISVDNNTVTGDDLPVWVITKTDTGISMSNGTAYLGYASSTNFALSTSSYGWNVAAGSQDGTFLVTSVNVSTRAVAYQLSGDQFGAYSTTNLSSTSYVFDLVFFEKATTGGETGDSGETGGETGDSGETGGETGGDSGETGTTSVSYTKVTNASEFTTGKYVLIAADTVSPTYLDSGWVLVATLSAANNTVTDPADENVWTLTVSGSSVKLTDSKGVSIAPKGGNNNGIISGDYDWAWTFKNGTFTFAGTGSDTVTLAVNTSSSNKIRAYKTATVSGSPAGYPSQFTLYKLTETN